jgi:hypothetical protein
MSHSKQYYDLLANGQKACAACRVIKPIAEFREYNGKPYSYCMQCHSESRLKQFGLTLADYVHLWARQRGLCAGCGATMTPGLHAHVDHNHGTGEVRALLCRGCNHAIGNALENPDTLRKLARYLERFQ